MSGFNLDPHASDSSIHYFIDDDGIFENAVKLLAGMDRGASAAIYSALKRATSSGAMLAQKEIRQSYVLSAATFKAYTKARRHYVTDASGTTAEIEFAGVHIPLAKFDTAVDNSGRVKARVKRGNARETLDHAFSANVGKYGHVGIFERVGEARMPIKELVGPSVPQMISYNEDLSQSIGDQIFEKFKERLDHEILAVLNGWNIGRGGGLAKHWGA